MSAEAQGSQESLVGRTVGGRFKILKKLAAGGMGVVYKAEQTPLGRMVAVKILRHPQDPRLDESFSKRFLLEAAAVANLSHPHTVIVHDYGRDGEMLYFAMEFVEGKTLTGVVRGDGPMDPAAAIHVAEQVASSLEDAHKQELVHRDLKPGNIMLTERGGDPNFTKVLDFGLVKMVSKSENLKLTQSGIMLGSPRYMAPEQVRGGDLDHRADIYSFGAVLCFMLTGKPPFPAGSQFEAMRAHVYTPAPALRELNPACRASERLEQLVLKCLEKDPAERPQSFGEIRKALEHCKLAPTDDDFDAKPTMMRDPSMVAPQPASFSSPPPAPAEQPPASPAESVPQSMADAQAMTKTLSWVLRGLVVVVVVAAAALAAVLIPSEEEEPEPPTPVTPVALAETTPETTPETMEPLAGETAEAAPQRTRVEIITQPSPARVLREGADLGDSPLVLAIPEGDEWALEIRARGYESRTVQVHGGQEQVIVRLDEERSASTMSTMSTMSVMSTMTSETMETMTNDPSISSIRDPWAGMN